jgi:conserved oligomeric Golgi complex subunit 5
VRNVKVQLVNNGHRLLESGLSSHSQADMDAGLQIFFNLDMLQPVVHESVAKQAIAVDTAIRSALDTRKLSAVSAQGGPAGRSRFGNALWAALEGATTCMHEAAVATWHLQRIIAKKRDPLTLTSFARVVQVCYLL